MKYVGGREGGREGGRAFFLFPRHPWYITSPWRLIAAYVEYTYSTCLHSLVGYSPFSACVQQQLITITRNRATTYIHMLYIHTYAL